MIYFFVYWQFYHFGLRNRRLRLGLYCWLLLFCQRVWRAWCLGHNLSWLSLKHERFFFSGFGSECFWNKLCKLILEVVNDWCVRQTVSVNWPLFFGGLRVWFFKLEHLVAWFSFLHFVLTHDKDPLCVRNPFQLSDITASNTALDTHRGQKRVHMSTCIKVSFYLGQLSYMFGVVLHFK